MTEFAYSPGQFTTYIGKCQHDADISMYTVNIVGQVNDTQGRQWLKEGV